MSVYATIYPVLDGLQRFKQKQVIEDRKVFRQSQLNQLVLMGFSSNQAEEIARVGCITYAVRAATWARVAHFAQVTPDFLLKVMEDSFTTGVTNPLQCINEKLQSFPGTRLHLNPDRVRLRLFLASALTALVFLKSPKPVEAVLPPR